MKQFHLYSICINDKQQYLYVVQKSTGLFNALVILSSMPGDILPIDEAVVKNPIDLGIPSIKRLQIINVEFYYSIKVASVLDNSTTYSISNHCASFIKDSLYSHRATTQGSLLSAMSLRRVLSQGGLETYVQTRINDAH